MTTVHKKHNQLKRLNYRFNPFEISVFGVPGFSKTSFILSLSEKLAESYRVSKVKYDDFSPKKDKNYCQSLLINHSKYEIFNYDQLDMISHKSLLADADIVLIDEFNPSNTDKILFLDDDFPDDLLPENIIACVSGDLDKKNRFPDIPFFQINDTILIKDFILGHFDKKIKSTPLYGLIMTGGRSSRMNQDKSLLEYYNKKQYQYLYEQLENLCSAVFISCRKEQSENYDSCPQIYDKYLDMGPIGGILSAMTEEPDASWLVIACDLPFIDQVSLSYLLENRNPFKYATAFQSSYDSFPEPLCTIYEPKSKLRLSQFLGLNYQCPRKALINSRIELIRQLNPNSLDNINCPEEHREALKKISETIK